MTLRAIPDPVPPEAGSTFKTIVVGADDSSTARHAVTVSAEIAELSGASLHIVTGYEPKSVRSRDLPDEFRFATTLLPADDLLHGLSMIGKRRGLDVTIHPAKGSPADAIIRIAEQEHADLVVVGNRGMTGIRRVLGSVPNSVAHLAPCSVLVVDTRASS